MNTILLVVILKIFITNTVQNLIRFGDFQNILPPQPAGTLYKICGAHCNGIWYTNIPPYKIELLLAVPGHRICVNMVEVVKIRLCQDFNVVTTGKIYQYTFDMQCFPNLFIKNCSAWVIINGQVVNGSNRTHTDKLIHKSIGYINITQKNNTICFQSQHAPFNSSVGTILDNISLQIYTEKVPCNVLGCKLCLLNFPDVCQVFQQPEAPQTPEEPQKPQVPEGTLCQSKFYLNRNICKICLFPCEKCQGQARNCISCQNLYHLQENQCVISDEWILVASMVASMPGIEFFSIGQIFLGISDQFWPYYSHHRVYGKQTFDILTFFHTLQNNKWFLLGLDKKINFNFQSLNLSDYSVYSNQQFLRMESKTSYFWDGAFEIVFFSFPTMIIVFFVLNLIFCLAFKYPISRHLRPFSFLLMIYFLGIGQDISYLSFLSFSNGMKFFSFKFQDKLGHIVWIFVFFLLVFFCSGGYFLAKFLHDKLSKYFIDGFFLKLQSFHILSCISMKAFLIGSANALLATNYETLIISLASIEIVFLIGVIYLQWKNRCYKIQTFMFLQMLKSIIMAIFNFSLWIDWKLRVSQQSEKEQQVKELLDFNCKTLIFAIIGLGTFQSISTYFSGREMLSRKRKRQVAPTKKHQCQVLKIINLKQKIQVKQAMPEQQQMTTQENYFYKTNDLKNWESNYFKKYSIKEQKYQDQEDLLKKHKTFEYYSLVNYLE